MGITFGDYLIDSGHYDPPEEEIPMTEKTASDAPAWYSAEQADAWACGYNAASDDVILVEAPTVSVWLREVDAGTDNACWVACAKGDPGAVEFVPA